MASFFEQCFAPGSEVTPIKENLFGELVHVMQGIPLWMAMLAIALIVALSHLILSLRKESAPKKSYWAFNILKFNSLKKLVKKAWFPIAMQSVSLLLMLLVIGAGLFGNQNFNIATVITWTWWWVLLIFFVLGFGKAFCMICPWEAMSSLVSSLSFKSRVKKIGFEYKWPKWGRNIFPAIIFFILLTWFELGYDVTRSPSMTATMAVAMATIAVLVTLFFEKRAFCRYVCLVGRINGIYSLFAPVELRAQSTDVCRTCKTKDCYKGTETETGCPTNLFPSRLQENTYCTLCTECIRSCPHDNIGINLRPLGTDLARKTKFRWDESVLAIVLLSLTSFHGVTMTSHWTDLNHYLRIETGLGPNIVFTFLMAIMLIVPIAIFWYAAHLSNKLTRINKLTTQDIFKAFSYSLIPIALFYHIAHNCMHFFMEAQHIIPLLSDPFGIGWNLFGTAYKEYGPLLSLQTIWVLQVLAIIIGHLYGVFMADRFAKNIFKDPKLVRRGLLPLILTMVFYSGFSIWLIAQPMEMRTGM